MKRVLLLLATILCLSQSKEASAQLLDPFCEQPSLFGPCGIGAVGFGHYYGISFAPGFWPDYWQYEQRFAAIAYATDGSARFGATFNYLSPDEAQAAALSYCGAPGCAIQVWTMNGCAAVATVTTDSTLGGYGWADSRSDAKGAAIRACRAVNRVPSCRIVVSVCNGW